MREGLENKSLESILKGRLAKIEENPQFPSSKPHIAQELGLEDRQQLLYGFKLHHDLVFHEKIETIVPLEPDAPIHDGDFELPDKGIAVQAELNGEGFFIDRLKQPGTQFPMHLNRTSDDTLAQFLVLELSPALSHPGIRLDPLRVSVPPWLFPLGNSHEG